MERKSIERVLDALNESNVRYLVVGGLAVVAHGYLRFTADLDLLLDFDEDNLRAALDALAQLGYAPRAPVDPEAFLDADTRAEWVRDKGMTVFSLFSPEHPATEVDLFVEPPLDFDDAYQRAVAFEIRPGLAATFIALEDLIRMKLEAGRDKDLLDVDMLRRLQSDAAYEQLG